jgi:hypothetical protein
LISRCASCLGLLAALAPAAVGANSFEAEGADTGAGLGARQVAQGGTGAATSDDIYAIYFNPAGLAQLQGVEFSVSRQWNAALHDINFLGAAWRLPLDPGWGVDATVAAAYYPRIHARASGAFEESDFESLFIRYLLPGIEGTFDGDIDSKTKTYRLALGLAPRQGSPWSLGVYVDRIDCKSNFCGVHATSNGYTTSSTGAKATAFGFGLRYRLTPQWTLAGSVSDLHTRLTLNSTTTDVAGTRTSTSSAQFPRKLVAAAAWRGDRDQVVAAEYEVTKGRYGRSEIDLQVLRLGLELPSQTWTWRAGAVAPIRIFSTNTGSLKAPFPFSPTLGLGWRAGRWKIDLAAYAHAVMSMHKNRASPAADLSLSWSL